MKVSELPAGTYRLTRDIQNPDPDRRAKHDWTKRPVWEAGLELAVHCHKDRAVHCHKDRVVCITRPGSYNGIRSYEERFSLFDDALEPLHETPRMYAERLGYAGTAMRTLERLIAEEFITEAQVIAAMKREEDPEG